MRVMKLKEAEIVCAGHAWKRGCGSTLAVTAEDVKTDPRGTYLGDGDYGEGYYIECPVCGVRSEVTRDLKLKRGDS